VHESPQSEKMRAQTGECIHSTRRRSKENRKEARKSGARNYAVLEINRRIERRAEINQCNKYKVRTDGEFRSLVGVHHSSLPAIKENEKKD
jgi:hypothetical protein